MKLMNSFYSLAGFLALTAGTNNSFSQTTETFYYTGTVETFVVPADVTVLTVTVLGASGADSIDYGGKGAEVTCDLNVWPGEILEIRVGGKGIDSIGGFNGGGNAGSVSADSAMYHGGGGGGASDIRRAPYALANRVIVAGGGGGMGGGNTNAFGGDALCPDGENGTNGFGDAGDGGTTTAGGPGGLGWGAGENGFDGTLGVGGEGATDSCYYKAPGGGGGGGYYGGGGGASDCFGGGTATGGGGGGGSSLIPGGCGCTPGVGIGNGLVEITYTSTLGITESEKNAGISVKGDVATIWAIGDFNYRFIDLSGKVVLEGNASQQTTVAMDVLQHGMYVVKISGQDVELSSKIVR
jgi:hypothetical protein